MLDVRELRRNPDRIVDALRKRGLDLDLSAYYALEKARSELQTETESLQHERNEISREIGKVKAAGEDIDILVQGVGDIGVRLEVVKQEFQKVQQELNEFILTIPNLPDGSVPAGMDEADNLVLRQFGDPPRLNFEAKDHVELSGGLLDFDAAVRIAGSRFSVLRGPVARLHRGLIQFMIDVHTQEHGYEELYVPFIVNHESMTATGQLPKFEDDLFKIQGDDSHYLIPTAEVPVTSMVRDQILNVDDLPLRFVSHTPCFRREAGSHGKDTRGMIRQHQFEKVELVQIVHPEKSWEALDELTSHAEAVLRKLGLPYQAVALCGGDLGFAAAKTIDLEVWLPSQDRYREVSSCSNFLDFQARRGQIRVRLRAGEKPVLVHTLNGSGLAAGRTMIAMMENYQDQGGVIRIPDVLQSYVGMTEIDPENI